MIRAHSKQDSHIFSTLTLPFLYYLTVHTNTHSISPPLDQSCVNLWAQHKWQVWLIHSHTHTHTGLSILILLRPHCSPTSAGFSCQTLFHNRSRLLIGGCRWGGCVSVVKVQTCCCPCQPLSLSSIWPGRNTFKKCDFKAILSLISSVMCCQTSQHDLISSGFLLKS